jgi:carbonic anhydrase/acetyltransferase-like protein (isoleucine patch superfamily)
MRPRAGAGAVYPFQGVWPKIDASAFIAPGARIIGDVEIGPNSSVWFNCVVRGDNNVVRIGAGTNIQDGSVIHIDTVKYGTFIGDNILIGHMALIHACTLEDGAFIGMHATVMDGAVVGENAMVAAGSLVTPGKHIPPGELWAGRPARKLRDISPEDIEGHLKASADYAALAAQYRAEYATLA